MRAAPMVLIGALSASVLAACSPAAVLGALQPKAPGGETLDAAYAPGPRHGIDIYAPGESSARPPVVVFFYGGSWQSGSRDSYRFVGRGLAACGALTFIPDYRVWPEAGFEGFMRDAAQVVAFVKAEAARRGGDPNRLYLVGHSAGAYIAMMLALDPRWMGGQRTDLAGAVGISGPYDFLPLRDPVLEQIFAPAGPDTQPITFASHARAPLLLMTGADDTTVYPANSQRLAAAVRAAGGAAETIIYPNLGHIGTIASFASPLRFLAPVRADVCRFLGLRAEQIAHARAPMPEAALR